ncbi:MAG: TIGR00304 family membrane protein [Pyrobaculum sp.]
MDLLTVGLLLIVAGVFLMALSILITALKREEGGESKTEAGGVVLIGPVPIVFGTSQRIAQLTLILAILLTALALLLFTLPLLR